MIKKLIAVGAMVVLTGCATGSGKINWDNARQVKADMTQQEVTKLMGQPYQIRSTGQGEVQWIWVHVNPITFASASASLTFKDGRVSDVWEIPDTF